MSSPRARRKEPAIAKAWFAQFYTDFYPRLVLIVLARTGDRAEAEEVAQEAFVRGYAAAARLAVMESPQAWLATVAYNVLRRRARRARFLQLVGRAARADEAAVGEPDPSEKLDLYRALRELPDEFREPIVLHYLADLTVERIGELLSVPVGTVKSRLYRGRQALAVALKKKERSES